MAEPNKGAAAGLAGVLALGGGFAAHETGLWDDFLRAVKGTHASEPPHVPPPHLPGGGVLHIPPDTVDALDDPLVATTVKEAISYVRALRNGDDAEKAFAKSACNVMSQAVDGQPGQDEWERAIREDFASSYSGTVAEQVANRYAPRVANTLWIAQQNGQAARWYFQYCVKL